MGVTTAKRLLSGQNDRSRARLVVATSLLFLFGLALHRLWAALLAGQWLIALVPLVGVGIAARFGCRHQGLLPAVLLGLAPFVGFVSLDVYYGLFGTPFVTTGGGPATGTAPLGPLEMASFGYPDHLTLGIGLMVVLLGYLLGRIRRASGASTGDA